MRRIERRLAAAGVVSPRAEARWLLQAAGHKDGTDPSPEIERAALELVARRATGEPLQYITGIAGFRRLELAVGPGVFIPRPETELVAEFAMDRLPQGGTLVDVGTGSGAIALSIAQERPDACVLATEISPDALAWARKNRDDLRLDIELFEGHLFDSLPRAFRGSVDVVVSNPPYVPPTAAAALPRDVVQQEPHIALFADEMGTAVVIEVATSAREWLKQGGWLVLEVGHGQGRAVQTFLRSLDYGEVEVHDDLAERERIAVARR